MTELKWECVAPGIWQAGLYTARRNSYGGSGRWELRRGNESLYNGLASCEECKRAAQAYEDRLNAVEPQALPVIGINRVEVIDNRACAAFRGRAFDARNVERTIVIRQDETLKVFLR